MAELSAATKSRVQEHNSGDNCGSGESQGAVTWSRVGRGKLLKVEGQALIVSISLSDANVTLRQAAPSAATAAGAGFACLTPRRLDAVAFIPSGSRATATHRPFLELLVRSFRIGMRQSGLIAPLGEREHNYRLPVRNFYARFSLSQVCCIEPNRLKRRYWRPVAFSIFQ